MDEKVVFAQLAPAINSLKTLALVALDMEESHPLALPEPPDTEKIADYRRQMTAIAEQVNPRHRALLNASLRDYEGGFPDRAATYLQELVKNFLQDPEYTAVFSSPTSKRQLERFLMDLRDV
ncbi:MAG: hypothetical protein AB7N91_20195 [Candidatus Tectimicrobiota bacterium]